MVSPLYYGYKSSLQSLTCVVDTNLIYINKSLKIIGKNVNYDLRGLVDWLNANLISLNAGKTEFVIFRSKRKKIDYDIKLKLNGKRLFPSPFIKYLGLMIDENLSWNQHIDELSKKLNRANGMLSKIRHYVNKSTLRTLYFSTFSSHLGYCCQIWGQNGTSHLNKVHSIQRSSLRIINFQSFRSNTENTFKDLKIPTFSMLKTSNLLFVFDSLKRLYHLQLQIFLQNVGKLMTI